MKVLFFMCKVYEIGIIFILPEVRVESTENVREACTVLGCVYIISCECVGGMVEWLVNQNQGIS